MKAITAHVHAPAAASSPETPDPRPGNYYVSLLDGPTLYTALGPFPAHALALAAVAPVRDFYAAHDRSGRSHFMAFGTVRMADDFTKPGNVNKYLPALLALPA